MTVLNKYHHGGKVPAGSVNIMRGSSFGNQFEIGKDGTREEVVAKYRRWLWGKIQADVSFSAQVRELHGRDICCCCAPLACHGDILAAAAEWLSTNRTAADLAAHAADIEEWT